MGLAIGHHRCETAAFGVDFTRRGQIFDEWALGMTKTNGPAVTAASSVAVQ